MKQGRVIEKAPSITPYRAAVDAWQAHFAGCFDCKLAELACPDGEPLRMAVVEESKKLSPHYEESKA